MGLRHFLSSLRMLIALTILTGIAYPLLVTGLGQTLFPRQAGGSLIDVGGRVVGSALVAQKFEKGIYFQSRPSAVDYNPLPSGGSNLAPTSKKLKDQVAAGRAKWGEGVPQDLLFASGSGLDPHVSPEAALYQIPRVAKARGLAEDELRRLVENHIEPVQLGFLGEPRVNVLMLNLALDRLTAGGKIER